MTAVIKELQWVAAELEAGRLTPAEASDLIRACEADAPPTGAATALLMGYMAGGDGAVAEGGGGSGGGGGGPDWMPQLGERVVVLTMGGAPGTVIQPPSKAGSKVRCRAQRILLKINRKSEVLKAFKSGLFGRMAGTVPFCVLRSLDERVRLKSIG